MSRRVEAIKKAVRRSLEKEEEWIKENYDSDDVFDDTPIPPMIFRRYHKRVYSGLTYFQVQKQYHDELFLKQIDMGRWIINYNSSIRSIIYDELVILLLQSADTPLEAFKKLSDAAKDTRYFDSVIHAAASFAFKLYTTEELIRSGQRRLHIDQLNKLWKMFAISGEKGCTIDEVCKSIVRKKIDRENYSLVTETDLYDMLSMYDSFLQCAELFKHSYKASISTKNKTTPMQDKIKELISKMELPTRSKVEVDEYTRFLINFVRQNTMEVQELRDKHMEMIDKEGLHALNPGLFPCGLDEPSFSDITFHLMLVLDDLTNWRRDHIRDQLVSAGLALFLVCDKSLAIANEVFEIIEVAELRRIALGSRFINRSHLIWAFYECGFGLPPKIRDNLDLPIAEEDHPPYVIYLASKELATSSTTSGFEVEHAGKKKKKLLLEHFVFSILYAKNIIDDKKQVAEMEEHFKTFVEAVALDGMNRPNSGSVSWLEAYGSTSKDEDQM